MSLNESAAELGRARDYLIMRHLGPAHACWHKGKLVLTELLFAGFDETDHEEEEDTDTE